MKAALPGILHQGGRSSTCRAAQSFSAERWPHLTDDPWAGVNWEPLLLSNRASPDGFASISLSERGMQTWCQLFLAKGEAGTVAMAGKASEDIGQCSKNSKGGNEMQSTYETGQKLTFAYKIYPSTLQTASQDQGNCTDLSNYSWFMPA